MDKKNTDRLTKVISVGVTFILFIYFWGMITRFDPMEQRGLTQRIFGVVVFGYISFNAFLADKLRVT